MFRSEGWEQGMVGARQGKEGEGWKLAFPRMEWSGWGRG